MIKYFYRLYSISKLLKITDIYFPVLYNISLLLIYFIHSSMHLLIPYPYLVPPLLPPYW